MLRMLIALLVGLGTLSTPEGIVAIRHSNPFSPMCHTDATNNPLGLQSIPQFSLVENFHDFHSLPESTDHSFTESCPWNTPGETLNVRKAAKKVKDVLNSVPNFLDNSKKTKLIKFAFGLNSKVDDTLDTSPNPTEQERNKAIIESSLNIGLSLIPPTKWALMASKLANDADSVIQPHLKSKDADPREKLIAAVFHDPLTPIPFADSKMARLSNEINFEGILTTIAAPARLVADVSERLSKLLGHKLSEENLTLFSAKISERIHDKFSKMSDARWKKVYENWSKLDYLPPDRTKSGLLDELIQKKLDQFEEGDHFLETIAERFDLLLKADEKLYYQFCEDTINDLESSARLIDQEINKKQGMDLEKLSLMRETKEIRAQIAELLKEFRENEYTNKIPSDTESQSKVSLDEIDKYISSYQSFVKKMDGILKESETKLGKSMKLEKEYRHLLDEDDASKTSVLYEDPWSDEAETVRNKHEDILNFLEVHKTEFFSGDGDQRIKTMRAHWQYDMNKFKLAWYKSTGDQLIDELNQLTANDRKSGYSPAAEQEYFAKLKELVPKLDKAQRYYFPNTPTFKTWSAFHSRQTMYAKFNQNFAQKIQNLKNNPHLSPQDFAKQFSSYNIESMSYNYYPRKSGAIAGTSSLVKFYEPTLANEGEAEVKDYGDLIYVYYKGDREKTIEAFKNKNFVEYDESIGFHFLRRYPDVEVFVMHETGLTISERDALLLQFPQDVGPRMDYLTARALVNTHNRQSVTSRLPTINHQLPNPANRGFNLHYNRALDRQAMGLRGRW